MMSETYALKHAPGGVPKKAIVKVVINTESR